MFDFSFLYTYVRVILLSYFTGLVAGPGLYLRVCN